MVGTVGHVFTVPHPGRRASSTEGARRFGVRAWDAAIVLSGVVLLSALDARGHVHAHVRLTETRWLSAPSSLALLAAAAVVAGLVGRRSEVAGFLGLAGVSFALGASWLLLGDHRFAGPVILGLSREHGVHIGDLLAAVPVLLGVALVRWALLGVRRRAS